MLSTPARISRLIFIAGLGAWIVNAAIAWLTTAPLGHDESQYAIAAKDMLAGAEPRWFYVSKGMSALAAFGNLAGGSEYMMRLPTFLFSIGFILATAQLARRVCGETTAAWTVALLAGARGTVKWSASLLSDMPAATCLVAATAILVAELASKDGPRWRVVLVAPLLAVAFYLRYASCVPIAILCVAAVVAGWPAIRRRPLPVIATALMFGLLFLPHAIHANETMGSPFGILLESKDVPGNDTFGRGLYMYVASNPFEFYGLLLPFALLAGLLAVRRDRNVMLLWVTAVAGIVAIGLITEVTQARYILFSTTLLAILGVDLIRRVVTARPERIRVAIVRIAATAVVASWVVTAIGLARQAGALRKTQHATLAAAAAIRADAGSSVCRVVGYHYTQLEWYSGCRAGYEVPALVPGERVYVVRDTTPAWQESDLPGHLQIILDMPGEGRVLRLDP